MIPIIFVIIFFFIYLRISSNGKEKIEAFNSNKRVVAEKLYNNVMNFNLDEKYPDNPDDVMGIQIDILMLLYGDMVEDDNIYKKLIQQQRCLFDEKLLDNNSFDNQYNNFIKNLDELREKNITCISISKGPVIYNNINTNQAKVKVEQIFSTIGKVTSIYYLKSVGNYNNWKIASWEFIENKN